MTHVAVLALLAAAAAAAAPDPLADARAAFAAGDYARAERLALAASAPPDADRALYLAALARFRAGRPADALEALDRARGGADSAAAWHYNRAACLSELGRLAEAEREYLAAAEDATLAPVALVGAGFAALDAGDADRARALATRARGVASGNAVALVADLEAQLGPGQPVPVAATPAEVPRVALREAVARVAGGWDSDALHAAFDTPERPGFAAPSAPSAYGEASAGVTARLHAWDGADGEVSYGVAQLAYGARAVQDRSVQQHGVAAALLLWPGEPLRLDLRAEGQLALAGLSDLRPMLASAGLRATVARDHGERATTRLELGWTRLDGRGAEFEALGGDRLQASVSEELRLEPVTLRLGYRLQLERIGTAVSGTLPVAPGAAVSVEPLGYTGHTGWLEVAWRASRRLELRLAGGVEWRRYAADDQTWVGRLDGSAFAVDEGRREALRAFAGETLTVRLWRGLSLFASHALLASGVSIGAARAGTPSMMMMSGPAGPRPADASSWTKNAFSVGTELSW
jgi:tetratricopeptide (TPR) repeat protein